MAGDKPPPDDALEELTLTGTLYAAKFDVIDRLGEGAMGTVYRARIIATGEWVALKRLHPEHAEDPEVTARFNREMEATSKVDHPNTVRVIDYGVEDGYLYLAMEILKGRPLDDVIVDDCPMEPERIAHIGIQIARALEAAHKQQFVHRDLKPENIMLVRNGTDEDYVKVLDFGLAAFLDDSDEARLTGHGLRVGTPLYMAPEYIEGKVTDHRSDLYALGVVLYMLTVGKAPYLGSPYTILHKSVTDDPTLPSDALPNGCPPWLEEIIITLMQKKPLKRIQTAAEVADLLERGAATGETPRSGGPPPVSEKAPTAPLARMTFEEADAWANAVIQSRTRSMLIVMGAVVLSIAGFAIGWFIVSQ